MTGPRVTPDLRRLVETRSNGQCKYCLTPAKATLLAPQLDHIIAQKHGGETEVENLAMSCALCNQHKGSDIASLDPADGALTPLFHPRRERWSDHFKLREGFIVPLTAIGRVTVRLLQLNAPERVGERELLLAAGALAVAVE